jgi:hypothetical protein
MELSAENPLFKTILKAASKAFKKLHERGTYEPKDLVEIKEFKELHSTTNSLLSNAIPQEVSNTLKAYLEKDVFVFSGLRTHAQLADARSYLKDEKGNIRSYNEFEQKVVKLNAQYNLNYLETEYNFAIQSGLSAEKWETFSDDDKRYYLQYRTAKDGKVRDSHLALDEITLPKSDAFWNNYMPPNGWNCRCNTVEVLADSYTKSDSSKANEKGEKATTQIGKNGKNKAAMFRFNPGEEKKLFPSKNAYTPKHCKGGKVDMSGMIGISSIVLSLEDERCRAKKLLEEELKDFNKKKNASVFSKPIQEQYETVYNSKSGGKVEVHELSNKGSDDFNAKLETAKLFADKGSRVRLLPEFIHPDDVEFRKKLFPNYENKKSNPDFWIDGEYHDLKSVENTKNITYNANKCYKKQSSLAIIYDRNDKFSQSAIYEKAMEILSSNNQINYGFKKVSFISNGKLVTYKIEQGVIVSD